MTRNQQMVYTEQFSCVHENVHRPIRTKRIVDYCTTKMYNCNQNMKTFCQKPLWKVILATNTKQHVELRLCHM